MEDLYPADSLVLTIISNRANFRLDEAERDSVIDGLQHNGSFIHDVKQLAEDEAWDIIFSHPSIDEVRPMIAAMLENVEVDFAVQHMRGRRKKMLISDMDSTMIMQECIDELADFAGAKKQVAEVTERAMRGELDFADSLRARVALLEGLDESMLQRTFEERITATQGASQLVRTMRANGAFTLLVSGGFTFFASRVAEMLGFEQYEANILDAQNGALTGRVKEPILDANAKYIALQHHCDELGIEPCDVIAVGDGANDLPMLRASGVGVAYRAKPAVRAQADIALQHSDLRALLYIQGYSASDITSL